jgi:hypothetical protein
MLKLCLFLSFLCFSLAVDDIASPSVAATLVDPSSVAAPSSQVAVNTEATEETHSSTTTTEEQEKEKTLQNNVNENTNDDKSLNENKMETEETKSSTETVSENTQTNEIVTSAEALTKNDEKTKTETNAVATNPETSPQTIPESIPETLSSLPSNDESITKTEKIETPSTSSSSEPNTEPEPQFDNTNPSKETQQTQPFPDDDYYGLLQNPADHLDRAAFQPSHTFVLSIEPGETMSLFEDVANIQVGKVVRGSWFVTNGDIKVTISESSKGSILYSSSSDSTNGDSEQQKEGSFRFVIPRPGKLTISLENPSPSLRAVSFAWLLGSDDDDPFVAKRSARDGLQERFDERKEGGGGGVLIGNEKDVNSFTQSMLKKVSTLHKDIDDVISLQQFADVRFARHLDTVESNKRRLLWWTITETIVILVSSALHVIVVQHVFDYRGFKRAFV